ncbi:MAG: S9 family peptidase [Pedosphaera sp.]|nr:S9 family peptidase [Pedosphaera sp.]
MNGRRGNECRAWWLAGGLIVTSCVQPEVKTTVAPNRIEYPKTERVSVAEVLHGVNVADPYRWLEDDNAPKTKAWVQAQNKVTHAHLESIPERKGIRARIERLWNYERYGIPFRQGKHYFFTKNDGLQNQSVLYVADSPAGPGKVLLDPNKLSTDGTVALSGYSVSEDGRHIAYGTSSSGSDWQEWHVRDVKTGKDLSDRLQWIKFSGASWKKDGSGFFYSRYDAPKSGERLKGANYFQKLYFHKLGTEQSSDTLVYHRPDQKEWGFGGHVTEDGRYLILSIWQGTDTRNRVYYLDLQAKDAKVVELLNDFDADYSFIANDGAVFYFQTDLNAPRSRVIAVDTAKPARANWREIIPQSEMTLRGVSFVNDRFIASYMVHARSIVRVFGMDGKPVRDVALPGIGSAGGFGGRREDPATYYSFTSFTVPGAIYKYDIATGQSTLFRQPKLAFDPAQFVTRQVHFSGKDGARIPMFIVHKRGLVLDGLNPTLLYSYGGFNISLTPSFSPANLVWMEMGGVYAMPNLRGGGEYGEEWHKAGMKLKKQTVFDDFIAAAEWLQANLYTRPDRLAISGGSNGGLLVGACMTQRPELYGAALPAVGVMDMLRFHKFTIGWAWKSEYGSAENPDEFKALYAYSPLHNLRAGTRYPATLVTTGDHDDRVVPAHSFKFAAALQAAHVGESPVLIRVETKAGHGAGKPTAKVIEEAADKWAFLVHALRMRPAPFPASE